MNSCFQLRVTLRKSDEFEAEESRHQANVFYNTEESPAHILEYPRLPQSTQPMTWPLSPLPTTHARSEADSHGWEISCRLCSRAGEEKHRDSTAEKSHGAPAQYEQHEVARFLGPATAAVGTSRLSDVVWLAVSIDSQRYRCSSYKSPQNSSKLTTAGMCANLEVSRQIVQELFDNANHTTCVSILFRENRRNGSVASICHGSTLLRWMEALGQEFLPSTLLRGFRLAAGDDGELDQPFLVALNHQRHHHCPSYRLPSFEYRQSQWQNEFPFRSVHGH